jgi:hypothetical protein
VRHYPRRVRLPQRRLERLRQIEVELRDAPGDTRLPIALQATGEVFSAAGVSFLERDAAAARVVADAPSNWRRRPELAEYLADEIALALATGARRRAVRRAVVELAEMARNEMPLLAGELERALGESVSDDADGDLVWVASVMRSFGRE